MTRHGGSQEPPLPVRPRPRQGETADSYLRRMVPGSYLVISQENGRPVPHEGVQNAYGSGVTLTGRAPAGIAAYFDGFDLVPPGLVPVVEWPAAQPGAWPPPRQPAQPTPQQPTSSQSYPSQPGQLS